VCLSSSSSSEEIARRQGVPGPFGTILVPLDGTELAEEALPVALAFAKRAGPKGKLLLVHARRSEPAVPSRGGAFELPPSEQHKMAPYLGNIAQRVKAEGGGRRR
jgi:nucleotide-binding universal stress UspA family protein